MSRKAVAFTLIAYFVAALAFAAFEEVRSPTLAVPAYTLGAFVGRAIGIFVPSGIIPVVIWAFLKFRAERAAGPLVLWAVLGFAFAYFENYGERANEAREIENIANLTMSEKQRADYLQSGARACAKTQGAILVSRQLLTEQQLGPYCQCFRRHGSCCDDAGRAPSLGRNRQTASGCSTEGRSGGNHLLGES
jgi:hypothetical protein